MPTEDERTREEANRLYWESDASVAGIADRMGISRRALYDVIRPRPAGRPCPACGAELVYRNRMGRTAGEVECPECGREETVAALDEEADEQPIADRVRGGAAPPAPGLMTPDRERTERAVLLGGAVAAGLVFGVVTTLIFWRR